MAKINENNQNNKIANDSITSKEKPKIPEQGLLNPENSNPENETTFKKWRRIVLVAIKSPEPPVKSLEQGRKAEPATTNTQTPKKQNTKNSKKSTEKFCSITKKKSQKTINRKALYLKKIVSIILFLILIITVLGFGIYNLGWQGKFINKVAQIIPYPASIIKTPCGYKNVSYSTYQFDLKAISHFYEQKKATQENFIIPTENQIKKDVLDKEQKNKFMECLAKKRKVTVTQGQIQTEIEKTIIQAGNQEALAEIIQNLYNWDIETFKEKVLYIYLLKENLSENISRDPEINKQAKEKIEKIYNELKQSPNNFRILAKEYSEDTETRHRGGDLNWIEKGQLDSNIENAAFQFEVGEISEIIQTNAGYHIIKIADKKTTPEGIEQVRISHILIKTRELEDWLNQELKKCKIYQLI